MAVKKKKRRMRMPSGAGSVHLVNDGKRRRKPWRARVPAHIEFDEETGTAKRKYIIIGYYETEIEAMDALAAYRKNPYTLESSTATFTDVFEMWKEKKYPTISRSGAGIYNSAYKNSADLHNMKMKDIRTTHLEDIMNTTQVGYQTQANMKLLWGQLFKFAMERDIVQKNYADFVKVRDEATGTNKTAIPQEDREKIWKAIDAGDPDAEIAMIYIYTGLRASELLEMRKDNIDLAARIMVGGLKTDAGKDRRIPIHKSILPFLERLMQTEGEYLIMRYDKGKPQKIHYQRFLQYNWNPLMERLGIKAYTPHYGRHTCATMLREAGVEEDLRKLILGHANGDITDRYTHHPDYMLIEAIDKLPGR